MRFRDLHINIKVRIIVLLFQNVTSNMILPFMSIYYAHHFGGEVTGIIMMITVLGSILSSFYGGYYADILGRRTMLIKSEQIRFISFILMAMVNSPWMTSPVLTVLFLVIINICFGISTPARESMIIDVSTPEVRKFVYTITYWTNNFALALGTLLGAFFYDKYFFQLLCCTALATLTTYIIMYIYIEETKPISKVQIPNDSKFSLIKILNSYKNVMRDKLFLKYFIASLLTLGLELQLTYYISIRLANEFGTQKLLDISDYNVTVNGVEMFGILRTENTILVIVLAAFVAKFTNKLSQRFLIYLGVSLFTIGYMVIGVSNNGWLLLIATFVFTIGELIYVPIKKVLLADIAKEETRSQYMAVNSLTFRGGLILGSLGITIGALIPSWSMSLIFFLMGLISVIIFLSVIRELKKSNKLDIDKKNSYDI
jgi:MFS transporter, DHA1 family, multidrug resistance protein B